MGQIQNAISGAVGSVAVGAIAEQKTKGLKKEISGLEGQVGELIGKKTELEGYIKDTHEEAKIAIGEAYEELDKVQARHSEVKGQLAEINLKKEQEAAAKGKEKYQRRVASIQSKNFQKRGKR